MYRITPSPPAAGLLPSPPAPGPASAGPLPARGTPAAAVPRAPLRRSTAALPAVAAAVGAYLLSRSVALPQIGDDVGRGPIRRGLRPSAPKRWSRCSPHWL